MPALDADTVGRLVPEINKQSVKVARILLTPIGAATPFGDEMVMDVRGFGNPDYAQDQEVAVLGFRSDPLWSAEAGLQVFSSRYFGYDEDYTPIEERLFYRRSRLN